MSSHKYFCALTVSMIVGAGCCVPTYAQHKMSLKSLFDLADRQNQRIKVSEAALKAAEEGVVSAKSAMLPSVELGVQGSYTGNAFLMSRGFSTSGTTEYIVPGLGPQQVQNGKQPTPHWGNSFTAQASQVIYAGGAIRSGIEMAKLGHQLAELDVEKNRQEVRFLITGYYLDLCKLQNQLQVIAKNIELTEKVIEQMKARREQGTVLKNDITRYELQQQSLLLTKTQLDDAQKIIRHQISTAIHLPEGRGFRCGYAVARGGRYGAQDAHLRRVVATDCGRKQYRYPAGIACHKNIGTGSQEHACCIAAISGCRGRK